MTASFILRCIDLGVIVIPFLAYSRYNAEGNFDDCDVIGIKYICVDGSTTSVFPNVYLELETSAGDDSLVGDTPQEALQLYITKKQ